MKNGGLTVFDLTGKEVQRFATPPAPEPGHEPGRFNNVDVVGNLAVVTDRGRVYNEECEAIGPVSPNAGKYLSADAEGLTIGYDHGVRTLYASSHGDSTFAVYRMDGRRLIYRAGFEVVDGSAADGVQHSAVRP